MIRESEKLSDADMAAILETMLLRIRKVRRPDNRGIMLLTTHIASLMMRYGTISQQRQDAAEFVFWIKHNGDGTPITPERRAH